MNWFEFSQITSSLLLMIQLEKENDKKYLLVAYNGPRKLTCVIYKTNPKNSDQIDFEDNYLDNINGDINTKSVEVVKEVLTSPFVAKILPNGNKIFRRTHGISAIVSGNPDNIDFVVPYDNCKITGIEIINGQLGDKINLKVLDTPEGTISGVPNYMLNQFGFNTYIADKFHVYESNYDADLIRDMKIRIEYDAINVDLLPKTIYINFILHEVVE